MTEAYLRVLFEEINQLAFEGRLPLPQLGWNSRLRVAAGRFIPSRRDALPTIEIASYLLEEPQKDWLVRDTLTHEMIHYWLWYRRKPYGHTPEFHAKMNELGVSRYNSVPRSRPKRYEYICPNCQISYRRNRRIKSAACGKCCDRHARGRFDVRFKLVLVAPSLAVPSRGVSGEVEKAGC